MASPYCSYAIFEELEHVFLMVLKDVYSMLTLQNWMERNIGNI